MRTIVRIVMPYLPFPQRLEEAVVANTVNDSDHGDEDEVDRSGGNALTQGAMQVAQSQWC